ncbi:MAG: cobalamin-dependent protein, partial [archaeon]
MRRKNFYVSLISLSECDLGIRCLSAFLKTKGIKTKMFFLDSKEPRYNKETIKQLKELARDSNLICISVVNFSFNKAIQVTRELRKLKKPIVWGGPIVTVAPKMCIKYNNIICLGEGEEAFLELAEKLNKKEEIELTKNFWFKRKNKIIRNELRPL